MSEPVRRRLPRASLSFKSTMRRYSSGSMPVIEMARLTRPRTASDDPAATGATTSTSGMARIWLATACH